MRNQGFSLVEILIAVAVLSTVLLGTYSFISTWGREASRLENLREISSLLLSAKTCVGSFGVPYLRSIPNGAKVPVWFGPSGTSCLTGATFIGATPPLGTPEVELSSFFWEGSAPENMWGSRTYALSFTSSTGGIPSNEVEIHLTASDGRAVKTLSFKLYE